MVHRRQYICSPHIPHDRLCPSALYKLSHSLHQVGELPASMELNHLVLSIK